MIALNSPVVAHAIGATATISSSPLYQNSTKQLHPTLSPPSGMRLEFGMAYSRVT